MSKSVTATLPAALLVIVWWQGGRLSWKRDLVPLLPFFAIGIAGGLFTAWVEQRYGGAEGAPYALGGLDRCLLAGRVVAFYLAKVLWPAHLIFIYRRWQVASAEAWQWVFPLALLAVLAVLWRIRGRSRTPLAAALFFVGTLFPALGFFNVYPFAYSYVADHFQYLAMMGVIALGAGGCDYALGEIIPSKWKGAGGALSVSGTSRSTLSCLLVCALGCLTWSRAHAYRDSDTLYRDTLAQNPQCWMARTNLGVELAARGRTDAAIAQYDLALQVDPSLPTVHDDLGSAYFSEGRTDLAVAQFEEALRLRPAYPEAIYNLSIALEAQGHAEQAIDGFYRTLRLKPDFFEARYSLAMALGGTGRTEQAAAEFQRALKLRPDFAPAHYNLGIALQALGRAGEARAQFARARSLGFSP